MKRKEVIITGIICVIFILLGSVGLSILYKTLFQPERLIEGENFEHEDSVLEKEQQEKEILYPFWTWKDNGTIEVHETNDLYFDFARLHIDSYQAALELVGLSEYTEKIFQELRVQSYVFHEDDTEYKNYGLIYVSYITQIKNESDVLITVLDNELTPVMCQYYSKQAEGWKEASISEENLSPEQVPKQCYEDIRRLDKMFQLQNAYQSFRVNVFDGENTGDKIVSADFPTFCEKYGEWRYYTDEKNEAYVCVLNTHHLILYYDKESHQFCGYSFAQNKIE